MPNHKIEANPYRPAERFPLSPDEILRSKTYMANITLLNRSGEAHLTGNDTMRDWEILPEGMLNKRIAPYIHPEVLVYQVLPKKGFFGWPTETSRQYDLWKEQLLVPEERLMVVAVDTEGQFADTGRRPCFFVAPVIRDGFTYSESVLLTLYKEWIAKPESNIERLARLKMYVAHYFIKYRRHPEQSLIARGQGDLGIALPALQYGDRVLRKGKE